MSAPFAGGGPMPGQWPESNHPTPMSHPASSAPPYSNPPSASTAPTSYSSNQPSDHPPSAFTNSYDSGPRPYQAYNQQPAEGTQQIVTGPTELKPGVTRKPSGGRACAKCGLSLSGQFVRALDATYHLECFTCRECGKIVASKFFPVPDEGPNQYPLCETDYFKRLDLICHKCGNALRGSYITALDRKYHIEHFTCSVCPTIFGAQDSYYEHDSSVYCHYHYSTRFAQRCHGCHNAILKQFVEIFRNGQNQHWHPECYMIHKYWNVRLHNPDQADTGVIEQQESLDNAPDDIRKAVRSEEERVEDKVHWIWRSLSTFEERAATCISDMLLHVSNAQYYEGIMAARKFIIHIELFFECTDELDWRLTVETSKNLSYGREAKLLCKKVVAFFQLLSESQTTGKQRLGVTQELLSLVTGLAHYLKLLIRICLQGALKLERESGSPLGLNTFLEKINTLDDRLLVDEAKDSIADSAHYVHRSSDSCPVCEKPVEDKCARRADRVFHFGCMICRVCGTELKDTLAEAKWSASRNEVVCRKDAAQIPDCEGGFRPITRLKQYVHLLKVAHARLLATLRSTGAIPSAEHPELVAFDNNRTDTLSPLGADPRNQLYPGSIPENSQPTGRPQSTAYEQTIGDIRRLRSTRMDQPLGNTMKRARSSRVIDGPGGISAHDNGENGNANQQHMQIVHDRDPNQDSQLMFGVNQMALDDIPRILQAEVTRDLRPNAAKYAGNNLVSSGPKPELINGQHRRQISGDMKYMSTDAQGRPRRYLSELSALEYFIVRHIAVLYMTPMLAGHFTQQELIELIETKRPNFWDRFGKAFAKDKNAAKKRAVFGRDLQQIVDRDGAESIDGVGPGTLRVPAVLDMAVSAMRNMDMSVEGVFRKNGNIRRLRELQEEIDANGCDSVDLSRENAVQVAALLKKFLRDLPDPVLTFKLHRLIITAARMQDDEKRRRVLHLTCCLLPKVHRDTMEVLFTFLNWTSSFHTVDEESGSKMDIHNLATVIAPNILYSTKNPEVESTFLAVEAVHTLIEYNTSMCEVPEEIVSVLNDPSLFENNTDLTTKELLKRFGDIGRFPAGGMPSPGIRQHTGSRPSQGRSGNVVAQDPQAWQNEASVRHVGSGATPSGNFTYGPSHGVGTPPQQFTPDPNGSPQRQSHNYRGHPGPTGPMGVTGAG
ncbi:RhoGAP-domain-containing protein [Microthyrium microscopicum]|uniref:RhoGAP-domain-containing protein n=1 Tax=Microthyrium microscopicum TaxID=703497 RepID=A0A6A6USU0_9PEZI|nr:RhoGAP-domain-containing protein [Microthyrium microscopicum]